MGKNTFNSIGKYLPDRTNIILSKSLKADNVNIFNNINNIFNHLSLNNYDEVWIIGGLQIYNLFLKEKIIDEIFITFINFDYNCDIFFPKISENFIEDLIYTNSVYDKDVELTFKKFTKYLNSRCVSTGIRTSPPSVVEAASSDVTISENHFYS